MIAGHLDAASLCNYRLVSKSLGTWTQETKGMNIDEWMQFNIGFEAQSRRHHRTLLSLACWRCKKLRAPDEFSDAQKAKSLQQSRACISCIIATGACTSVDFKVGGKKMFGCSACRKAKTLNEEHTFNGYGRGDWYWLHFNGPSRRYRKRR